MRVLSRMTLCMTVVGQCQVLEDQYAAAAVPSHQDNEFSGPVPLPNGTAWTRVQHLRINNNQFSGPLPAFGYNQVNI